MTYEKTPLTCYHEKCFLKGHTLVNTKTGEEIPLHCTKYSCSLHGWRRKWKLQNAIKTYLEKFHTIRFWTFTLSSKGFNSPRAHYAVLSLAFRYFTTYMRRHKKLTESEQEFQYVKVIDLHKSGYVHFHAFFDRFISIYKVWSLWNLAIKKASGDNSLRGSAHGKRLFTAKQAAGYISKYVVKASRLLSFRLNYYSKSSRISLFPKKDPDKQWMHISPFNPIWSFFRGRSPLLVPKIDIVTAEEEFSLFFNDYG